MKGGELYAADFELSEGISADTKMILRFSQPQIKKTYFKYSTSFQTAELNCIEVSQILQILVERNQGQFYFREAYSPKKSMEELDDKNNARILTLCSVFRRFYFYFS